MSIIKIEQWIYNSYREKEPMGAREGFVNTDQITYADRVSEDCWHVYTVGDKGDPLVVMHQRDGSTLEHMIEVKREIPTYNFYLQHVGQLFVMLHSTNDDIFVREGKGYRKVEFETFEEYTNARR